jgi:hypothetical protein
MGLGVALTLALVAFGGPKPETPLEKRGALKGPMEAPVSKIIQHLRDAFDTPIELEDKAFRETVERTLVHCPRVEDVRFGTVLKLVADQFGGRVEVREGTVVISRAGEKERPREEPSDGQLKAEKALKKQLETKFLTHDRGFQTVLREELEWVAEASGTHFNICFDVTAFRKAKARDIADSPVALPAFKDQPVSRTLKRLLSQVNATYEVVDNIVLIVPARVE